MLSNSVKCLLLIVLSPPHLLNIKFLKLDLVIIFTCSKLCVSNRNQCFINRLDTNPERFVNMIRYRIFIQETSNIAL